MSLSTIQSNDRLAKRRRLESEDLRAPGLPREMWVEVAMHLESDRDLAQFASVCRIFKAAVESNRKLHLRRLGVYKHAFGKAEWARYFGDTGEEPLLPADISLTLNAPCRIWKEKKVHETHILVLVPSCFNNNQPVEMGTLAQLGEHPKIGYKTYLRMWYPGLKVTYSHWVLMTKNIIPESLNKSYSDQCQMVKNLMDEYRIPRCMEVVVCFIAHHVKTGKGLLSLDSGAFTRCEETGVCDGQMVVGGFRHQSAAVSPYFDNEPDANRGIVMLKEIKSVD